LAENRKKADEIKERVQQDMSQARLRGFGKTLLYTEQQVPPYTFTSFHPSLPPIVQIEGAVSALYQSIGIGGLRPNTVFLNFPRMGDHEDHHTEQMIFAGGHCCNLLNNLFLLIQTNCPVGHKTRIAWLW
jgi:hypothetical protein